MATAVSGYLTLKSCTAAYPALMDLIGRFQIELYRTILRERYTCYPICDLLLPAAGKINKPNQVHGLHAIVLLFHFSHPVRSGIVYPASLDGKKPVLRAEQETIILRVSEVIQGTLKKRDPPLSQAE